MTDFLSGFIPPKLNAKLGLDRPKKPKQATQASAASKASEAPKGVISVRKDVKPNSHGFKPLSRVRYIGTQICKCCGHETKYIAADLLKYSTLDKVGGVATVRTRAIEAADAQFAFLPNALDFLESESVTCLECLRLDEAFDAALNGYGQLAFNFETRAAAGDAPFIVPAGTVKKAKAKRVLAGITVPPVEGI